MRVIDFYRKGNRSGGKLRIQTEGAVIDVNVNLTDAQGRRVLRVDVEPSGALRGGDGAGNFYGFTGHDDPGVTRVVRYRSAELPDGTAPEVMSAREVRDLAGAALALDYEFDSGDLLTPDQRAALAKAHRIYGGVA
jgi:hypothetical protein